MEDEVNNLLEVVIAALEDQKGVDVESLDVKDLTDMTDFMVIATGTSNRHLRSLANSVTVAAKEAGTKPLGSEGEDAGEWLLVDLGVIVVHIMLADKRELYQLEKLWSRVGDERDEREE